MSTPEAGVALMVTVLAGLAALAIALALPAAYAFAVHGRLQGSLETGAALHAAEVVEMTRQNPAFWEFDALQVSAGASGPAIRRRVLDSTGRMVMEAGPPEGLAWPVMARRAPVVDGGRLLGEAEAARSVRPEMLATLAVGGISTLFGLLVFGALRVAPLRMLRQALDRAAYLAAHDLLTGLPNRGIFSDRLRHALGQTRRSRQQVAVLCLDLDRFKEVNDTLGHAAGDMLLRTVARRLGACVRESDTVARLGGDEFAIIQPQVNGIAEVQALAQRIVEAIERPIDLDGPHASVGVSIGIAVAGLGNGRSADPLQMLKDADLALYQAKESGRGRWSFFSPEMNRKLMERRALEADLRKALSEGQFRLAYQPQLDLKTKRVTGAEALLRWQRPGYGNVSPDSFIGLAEEVGLIAQIGNWALQEACRQAVTWPGHLRVAVNVSAVQFRLPGLYESVAAALATSGLHPGRLELEITEGVLLSDTVETLVMLERLRSLGVKIAMDDFGTGYSSLGYLQKFRFDKIKIDRSFVRHLGENIDAEAIVRAVVGMSRTLGIRSNAEGVESQEQADLLASEGCMEVQGYLFGKPMTADDFAEFLKVGGSG
ncbi:EAL domain-containing protein [Paeniroseomonas aquatica]|uniref:EAL domain-containing protein n=2 Tax=Paeniroseomonas aquatica TaxID=373043 RepID=A0ABT8AD38_9PROT|nr:EAL domain-containing protein [Paeniroseomonas aquatica]MDN3567666.1 EAL domain-containing protein [Paeniroseomonas aquatica]